MNLALERSNWRPRWSSETCLRLTCFRITHANWNVTAGANSSPLAWKKSVCLLSSLPSHSLLLPLQNILFLNFLTAAPLPPCYRSLALSIVSIVSFTIFVIIVYVKFKIDMVLFLRDTLGCRRSSSGTCWATRVASARYFCLFCTKSCCCLLRRKDLRCLFDVLQEPHRCGTEWTGQKFPKECFGRKIWLLSLS